MAVMVRGKVEKIADISSENVRLEGNINEDLSKTVTIIPSEKYNFNILSCKVSSGKNIDVVFKRKIIKEDSSEEPGWELHIKNISKTPGRYYEAIHLKTDLAITPTLTIRVFGNIK